jgi:hypothetical protein
VNFAPPRCRFAAAQAVADAVLYEGYVLYPYRASARKNKLRWQFGVLRPPAHPETRGSPERAPGGVSGASDERSSSRTEVICRPSDGHAAEVAVRARFLHLQHRSVEAKVPGSAAAFAPVAELVLDGALYETWDEGIERSVDLPPFPLAPAGVELVQGFAFPGVEASDLLCSRGEATVGRLRRHRSALEGELRVTCAPCPDEGFYKISVTLANLTAWAAAGASREELLRHCLVGAHTMLSAQGGTFVSLLDPAPDAEGAARSCHNEGTYPVLVGDGSVVLSSPIILYDYPEVAPEAPIDLYDATEIDEILALRVVALADSEKAEARATDPRAAAVVDACEAMAEDAWERLHGQVRPVPSGNAPPGQPWWSPEAEASVDPARDSLTIAGVEVRKGTGVLLRPSRRADAQDIFFAGRSAKVAGVFFDVDGGAQVAVSLDGLGGDELAMEGRYLFFHPDELEPVPEEKRG